jgi:sugar (pentulose or hexulose) kinase
MFTSDWHNALKLGYDVHNLRYPEWMTDLLAEQGINSNIIPKVIEPGQPVAVVNSKLIKTMGYNPECKVVAGNRLNFIPFL